MSALVFSKIVDDAIAKCEATVEYTAHVELRLGSSSAGGYMAQEGDVTMTRSAQADNIIDGASKRLMAEWASVSGQKKGQKLTPEQRDALKTHPLYNDYRAAMNALNTARDEYCPNTED